MYLEVHKDLFDAQEFARIGRGILGAKSNDALAKLLLSDLLRSRYPDNAWLGRFLLRSFWNSRILALYRARTGEELLLQLCNLRYQRPGCDDNDVPWHLDANFFGFGVPMLTVWAPFVPVGRDAAGLEFCVPDGDGPGEYAVRAFWSRRRRDDLGRRVLADADLDDFFDGHPWRIASGELSPGDAFVFDQYTLHRTQLLEKATGDRVAVDYRVASRDRFPDDRNFEVMQGMRVAYKTPDDIIRMGDLRSVVPPPDAG